MILQININDNLLNKQTFYSLFRKRNVSRSNKNATYINAMVAVKQLDLVGNNGIGLLSLIIF